MGFVFFNRSAFRMFPCFGFKLGRNSRVQNRGRFSLREVRVPQLRFSTRAKPRIQFFKSLYRCVCVCVRVCACVCVFVVVCVCHGFRFRFPRLAHFSVWADGGAGRSGSVDVDPLINTKDVWTNVFLLQPRSAEYFQLIECRMFDVHALLLSSSRHSN